MKMKWLKVLATEKRYWVKSMKNRDGEALLREKYVRVAGKWIWVKNAPMQFKIVDQVTKIETNSIQLRDQDWKIEKTTKIKEKQTECNARNFYDWLCLNKKESLK